jgi:uncharacterized OsmC-like protein
MNAIHVHHVDADRFRVEVRGHELTVDQPLDDGGGDQGPTPTELFVAGLASCVAFYAGRYLRRHGLATDGLGVACEFGFATDRPARVSEVRLHVSLPDGFPEARRAGLQAVVEHCTVHNSIRQAPDVTIELDALVPVR